MTDKPDTDAPQLLDAVQQSEEELEDAIQAEREAEREKEVCDTFILVATLPYKAPHLDCCIHGTVEVLPGHELPATFGHNAVLVEHCHSNECDVWRSLP